MNIGWGNLPAIQTCTYLFDYLFGHSHLQERMAEAGALVCLMLAAILFFQTLRFQTEVNFEMDGRRRNLKLVSSLYMLQLIFFSFFQLY